MGAKQYFLLCYVSKNEFLDKKVDYGSLTLDNGGVFMKNLWEELYSKKQEEAMMNALMKPMYFISPLPIITKWKRSLSSCVMALSSTDMPFSSQMRPWNIINFLRLSIP